MILQLSPPTGWIPVESGLRRIQGSSRGTRKCILIEDERRIRLRCKRHISPLTRETPLNAASLQGWIHRTLSRIGFFMLPQWIVFEDNRLTKNKQGSARHTSQKVSTTRGLSACVQKLPVTRPSVPELLSLSYILLIGVQEEHSRLLDAT
ncbi:hypothetical protein BDN72DRAFT_575876 [Pluteus cervinus]|uniref:Uncharacterized protein n=1 Tax=Pluteus cervinus TaxID=181527 RepID=A0ACD3AW61_9AGAR|nr:hypothetical protein BDN72DRAFT_575876 [Pluteus cervinus]